MKTVKLSSKYQVVIPRSAREALKLKSGALLNVSVQDGQVNFTRAITNRTETMRGLGKEVWKKLGGADKYIKQERASWGN